MKHFTALLQVSALSESKVGEEGTRPGDPAGDSPPPRQRQVREEQNRPALNAADATGVFRPRSVDVGPEGGQAVACDPATAEAPLAGPRNPRVFVMRFHTTLRCQRGDGVPRLTLFSPSQVRGARRSGPWILTALARARAGQVSNKLEAEDGGGGGD